MNRLHMLIGGAVVVIILMVFFGKNPMEEARKRRQMKKTKTLVEKIVTHANKKDISKGLLGKKTSPTGLKYGMDTSSDIEPMETTAPVKKSGGSGNVTSVKQMMRNQIPSGQGRQSGMAGPARAPYPQGAGQPDAASTPAPPPADAYYPPPALKRGVNGRPTSSLRKEDLFEPGFGMRLNMPVRTAGRPAGSPDGSGKYETRSLYVAFEGVRAYTLNGAGEPVPLPDGVYEMPGSRRKVLIRGGEKTIPN